MKAFQIRFLFGIVLLASVAVAVPPTPQPDPSGVNKNRYISMSIPDTGGSHVAIRVTLTSLMHPNPPNMPQIPPPNFNAFQGQFRWVGPPLTYTEDENNPTPFKAAQLQCTPYYTDFASFGLFHVFGDAVVPSSLYDVVVFDASCNGTEATCAEISSSLQIMTTRWGDVAPVFQQPSPAQLVQPNFVDVDAEFKKIERIPGSSNKVQLQLQPNVPNPTRTVNVMDAALVEDAYQGLQYFFSGPTSCGSEQRETHPPPEQNHNAGLSSPFLRGGQTPTLYVTPVLPQGSIVYPPGTSIIGQELHARTGGFRAFFNLQISNWDPGSTPTIGIRAYQVQVDASGFLSSNADPPNVGGNLELADVGCSKKCDAGPNNGHACTSSAQCPGGSCTSSVCQNSPGLSCHMTSGTTSNCPTGTGPCVDMCTLIMAPGSTCGKYATDKCDPVAIDDSRTDYLFGGSLGLVTPIDSPLSSRGPIIGTVAVAAMEAYAFEPMYYLGTFALDIPSNALGRYTIGMRPTETMLVFTSPGVYLDFLDFDAVPAVVDIGGVAGDKNRYLSIGAPDRGEAYAIRVKLTSLMHPDPPNLPQYPAPDFSAYEGQYRWVGPVSSHTETQAPPTTFLSSTLQCGPFYSDFHADTSGGVLHLTGRDVVPSSIYDIDIVPLSCQGNEGACADIVPYVTLKTARHGDVASPNQQPSPATLSQPDISDVAAIVDKFKTIPGVTPEITAFTDLAPLVPVGTVNIGDVGVCVDAFKGYPYVQGTPTNCP